MLSDTLTTQTTSCSSKLLQLVSMLILQFDGDQSHRKLVVRTAFWASAVQVEMSIKIIMALCIV